ncbi:hypothetical protein KSP40_PGU007637 [Platanthera guangdongensis]|uniref:TPX2 C-terminal domain-containing protein n=1 Tax=Platanthera guangdongensis TaxID=2320717 RepID=A0ABR2N0E9_9ASPA
MAGEVEESITLQAKSLPTDSISFGRFELESLCWERRSIFPHNRYLEEVGKYSTPGSVTKKKEYFEAHFKKKALLRHVPEENQNEAEIPHFESTIGDNCNIMGDFIGHVNSEPVEFSSDNGYVPAVLDDHEAVELQKEEISTAELIIKTSSFNDEKFAEQLKEPLSSDGTLQSQSKDNDVQLDGGPWAIVEDKTTNDNANSKEQADNGDVSWKIRKSKKKRESIQMKTQKVSTKSNEAVEPKIGKSQSRAHLPTQQIPKRPTSNSKSVTSGIFRRVDKQNMSAKVEKQITPKVSSLFAENGNLKIMASRNMKAKASSEIKSEGIATAKKVGINTSPVDKRQSDARQPVNRVKLVSKVEDKQNSTVFNFKSSERAEKRKEYNLKMEKKLHAKEAEKNEIQAKTEVVKEAELKQLRKSLNFKASPMPSFYHETTSRVSDVKKASTIIPVKPQEKSTPSPSSNRHCDHNCNRTISPSISSAIDEENRRDHTCSPMTSPISGSAGDCSSRAANRNSSEEGIDPWKYSVESKSSGTRKKEARKSGVRAGVGGIVGGSLPVHVAS